MAGVSAAYLHPVGLKVAAVIREHGKPDFVALEEQPLAKIGNTSADALIYPWVTTTAIVSTIANFGIPQGTLPQGTWRRSFYGQTFKPPLDNKGKKDWKSAAVTECERMRIRLPSQRTRPHNAAEACVLLRSVGGVRELKVHAGRYQEPLMALRMQRNERIFGQLLAHKYLWEKQNGSLPDGMFPRCLDGDKTNPDSANWEPLPRAKRPYLNGHRGLELRGRRAGGSACDRRGSEAPARCKTQGR
ncbi:hypothetical protein [Rhizobium yanglingense]